MGIKTILSIGQYGEFFVILFAYYVILLQISEQLKNGNKSVDPRSGRRKIISILHQAILIENQLQIYNFLNKIEMGFIS